MVHEGGCGVGLRVGLRCARYPGHRAPKLRRRGFATEHGRLVARRRRNPCGRRWPRWGSSGRGIRWAARVHRRLGSVRRSLRGSAERLAALRQLHERLQRGTRPDLRARKLSMSGELHSLWCSLRRYAVSCRQLRRLRQPVRRGRRYAPLLTQRMHGQLQARGDCVWHELRRSAGGFRPLRRVQQSLPLPRDLQRGQLSVSGRALPLQFGVRRSEKRSHELRRLRFRLCAGARLPGGQLRRQRGLGWCVHWRRASWRIVVRRR